MGLGQTRASPISGAAKMMPRISLSSRGRRRCGRELVVSSLEMKAQAVSPKAQAPAQYPPSSPAMRARTLPGSKNIPTAGRDGRKPRTAAPTAI